MSSMARTGTNLGEAPALHDECVYRTVTIVAIVIVLASVWVF